jgi:hypothetical protein
VILVGPKTELAFGATHDPDASKYFLTTRADLLHLWYAPGPFILLSSATRLRRYEIALPRSVW